jgi:hypothetical protein
MKRIIIIVIGVVVALNAIACKRAGDVLVTYKGGQITRGEFYEWLDARRMPKDAIIKNKSQQKTNLERFVVEKLIVQEARKAGYEKSKDFQFLKTHAVRNFYGQYMSKLLSTEGKFSEDAAKVRIIKLMVKNYRIDNNKRQNLSGGELEAAINEKMEKARSIIGELNKGESFDELAKKYSDDFSKRKGGDIGYIIAGMRGEDFSNAVFAVKKGTYTKEPLRIANAVYIIKVDDTVKLTEDNIEKVIDDKTQQIGLKRRLAYNAAIHLQDNLLKSKDIVNNTETVVFYNPAAVIYKIGKKEFTVADLNKLLDFIMSKRKKMGRVDMPIEEKMKRELAKRILREEVLMREAQKRGIDKDEKFKRELQYFIDYNLSGTYESEVFLADVTVTPQEVREYYNKNLDRMYTRNINEGGKSIKKVIPFGEVSQSVERRLTDEKRSEKRKTWVADMLSKNNFKINDSELEGK